MEILKNIKPSECEKSVYYGPLSFKNRKRGKKAVQRFILFRSELEGGISGRHLQCGYMDWDEIKSTMRVIRTNLQK